MAINIEKSNLQEYFYKSFAFEMLHVLTDLDTDC